MTDDLIHIARADLEHLDLIVPLFASYRAFYGQSEDRTAGRSFLEARLRSEESLITFALVGGAPAGFAQIYPAFSSVYLKAKWILNDLYVALEHRRRGVARALLKDVAERAKSAGVRSVVLETAAENRSAQVLYRTFGFAPSSNMHFELLP